MKNKKRIIPLAVLNFLFGAAFAVLLMLSIIDFIEWIKYMDFLDIMTIVSTFVGEAFIFVVPAIMLGKFYINMANDRPVSGAASYTFTGWLILFIEVLVSFIKILVNGALEAETVIGFIATLFVLIVTGILFAKREAYSRDLTGARVASVMYLIYLGGFETVYKIANGTLSYASTLTVITFVITAVLGILIPLSFILFYFALGGKAVRPAPAQPNYVQQNYAQPQFNGYGVQPQQQAPAQPQAPATKFCPFCGAQMPAGSAFCSNCGGKLQ